jgi:hypothetical protein
LIKNRNTRPLVAAIFLVALYLGSCSKQELGVGVELYSNNQLGVHYVDTFKINSYSKIVDSVISNGLGVSNLGFYNDPFFGKTKAGFYTQFEIGSSGVDFGDTLTCDSIVLYLKLGSGNLSYYGPENKPLRINVQQISKSATFTKDDTYYTSSSLSLNRSSLLDPDFDNLIEPNFFDTVPLSRDSNFTALNIPGVIRLKLKTSFGQEILNLNGTSVLESNNNFLEEYKGLYVSVIGEDGEDILFINMSDFGTAVMIYYKEGSDQQEDEYKFIIDNFSAHFNAYDHDYDQSASLRMKAVLLDSTIGNNYFFNQSGGGFKAIINFPSLESLRDSQLYIPVNKAELILPVEPGSNKIYAPPSQLYIFRINDEGKEELILDQYLGTNHIDGIYNAEKNQYRFNIVKHVQAILNGDINENGLVIKTTGPGSTPNRLILNGNEADTSLGLLPMKLRLYYSSLIVN